MTVTDPRVPSCPGADFAAVCPPAFTVPTFQTVSSGRLFQWRTTFTMLHVSALDGELHVLDVLLYPFRVFGSDPHAWIGGLDRLLGEDEPLVLGSGRAHDAHQDDGREAKGPHQVSYLHLLPPFLISVSRKSLGPPLDPSRTVGLLFVQDVRSKFRASARVRGAVDRFGTHVAPLESCAVIFPIVRRIPEARSARK